MGCFVPFSLIESIPFFLTTEKVIFFGGWGWMVEYSQISEGLGRNSNLDDLLLHEIVSRMITYLFLTLNLSKLLIEITP